MSEPRITPFIVTRLHIQGPKTSLLSAGLKKTNQLTYEGRRSHHFQLELENALVSSEFDSRYYAESPIFILIELRSSLAQMELAKVVAAFFLRFDGEVDTSMTLEDMRMYDTFNAGPAGAKLLLHLKERAR